MPEPLSSFLVHEEKVRLKDILNRKEGIPKYPVSRLCETMSKPTLSSSWKRKNSQPMTFLWLLPDPENVKVHSSVHRLDVICFVPPAKLDALPSTQGLVVILTETLRIMQLHCQEKESEAER